MSSHNNSFIESKRYHDSRLTMPAGTTVTDGAGDNHSTSPLERDMCLHTETNSRIFNRRDLIEEDNGPIPKDILDMLANQQSANNANFFDNRGSGS